MSTAADIAFASSVRELGQGSTCPCVDPECSGIMESDQDGDHSFMECDTCGYAANYSKIPTSTIAEDADGNCSIGVPAEIRKAHSGVVTTVMDKLDKEQNPQQTNLGLTIGRRPGI